MEAHFVIPFEVVIMAWKRAFIVATFVSLLTGTLLTSKPSDVEAMIRIGKKAAGKIESALPEARIAAGPLAAFRAGDVLPIEERVRVRIQTEKAMAGADIVAVAMPTIGEVKLKGIVRDAAQKRRAVEIANSTAGVEVVIDELAVPEK